MIFELFDNVVANIEIEGVEIPKEMLQSILLLERVGGALPVLELTLKLTSYEVTSYLQEGCIIRVGVGTEVSALTDSDYEVKDYEINGDSITVSCVLYIPDHLSYDKQWSKEATLSAVVEEMRTIKPDVKMNTNDKQVWIKHGAVSDWDFVINSVMRSYISDEDFLMVAYTADGRLKFNSYLGVLGNPDFYTAKTGPDGVPERSLYLQKYKVHSNRAIWDKTLVHRSLPVFNVVTRKTDVYGEGRPLPQLVDCGNCHDNYYLAYNKYLKKSVGLTYNVLALDFNVHVDSSVEVMDKLAVNFGVSDQHTTEDDLSGDYIVIEKSRYFSPSACYSRLYLGKKYDSNS